RPPPAGHRRISPGRTYAPSPHPVRRDDGCSATRPQYAETDPAQPPAVPRGTVRVLPDPRSPRLAPLHSLRGPGYPGSAHRPCDPPHQDVSEPALALERLYGGAKARFKGKTECHQQRVSPVAICRLKRPAKPLYK